MLLVWTFLKVIEGIIGIYCLIAHIQGLNKEESIPHVVFFCATFFGFSLTAFYGAICIIIHHSAGVTTEVFINFLGCTMHIVASMWSMYLVEQDVHLQYLSDFEEPLHPFFIYCRRQSIAALICGCVYMMHCAFACDILFTKPSYATNLTDDNYEATQTLQLYFICAPIHNLLYRYPWFCKYMQRESRAHISRLTHVEDVGSKARYKAQKASLSLRRSRMSTYSRRSRISAISRSTISSTTTRFNVQYK